MTHYEQLKEATRVRPNTATLRALRDLLEDLEGMADTNDEILQAEGLRILVEMAEKLP